MTRTKHILTLAILFEFFSVCDALDHKSDTTNRNDDFHKSHVNHHHRLWMHGQEPEEKHCCAINQPCRNGGTCNVNEYGLTVCLCPKGFTGPVCNIDCSKKEKKCPHGFEMIPPRSGKCYHICSANNAGSFWQAQKHCRDLHAKTSLWEPESLSELVHVTEKLEGFSSYWTGIFDVHEEGQPIFVGTGKPFSFTHVSGINREIGDCVKITRSGNFWKLRYDKCIKNRRCICEIVNPCEIPDEPVLPVPRQPMYG